MKNSKPPRGTVLIVDDDLQNLKVLNAFLRQAGLHVLLAKNGPQCLESAELGRPDVILLDIVMLEMDGYDVCRRLKANPKTKDIPVMFLSALAETENILQGFAAGGVDYITKPFRREEVLARVMAHVTIQRQKKELMVCNANLEAEIKEKEETAASLARSERRLNEAQVLADMGSWEADLTTHDGQWSQNLYRLLGYAPGEVEGSYELLKGHIHPQDLDRVSTIIENCVQDGSPCEAECRYLRLNGNVRRAQATGKIERDEDSDAVWMIGMFQDITERKRAERKALEMERRLQTAQRLESLGILAGGIAHDFNNILFVVTGNLELAGEELPKDSPARPFLRESEKAVHRAVHLVRQMLAYAGKGQFVLKAVDIGKLIQQHADQLRDAVSGTRGLIVELKRDLPPVKGDVRQLQQLLTNLVVNAAEAYEKDDGGAVTITVGVQTCDRDYLCGAMPDVFLACETAPVEKKFVHIDVADDGVGM
jgi:PAS domain S-box-containing protein